MKHIYFVNAHPDDLLTAVGIARKMQNSGNFTLHIVDMTHGERGLLGKVPPEECRKMRDAEEREVCAALGVEPVWLFEHDGGAFASEESTRCLAELYQQNPPDAIFTQWPVDRHLDHLIAAAIALNAVRLAFGNTVKLLTDLSPEIFFYHYAGNSMADCPDTFLPLTEEEMAEKVKIISLYRCQNGSGMAEIEKAANRFWGKRIGKVYAEAYTRMRPLLPGEKSVWDELIRFSE